MALLANGAMVFNSGNQAAVLGGLISALTKEEVRAAAKIFSEIQERGNYQTQEVWNSLWKQWGRVDPVGCLSDSGENAVLKTSSDARNVMTGWLETDADAALAWAQEPRQTLFEAAAAALAIGRSAQGDVKRLEAAMLALPADSLTRNECFGDYFDLASLAGEDQTTAKIYDEMPPALRPAAWTEAAKRIGYEDPAAARAWVSQHAADPGRNYPGIADLFYTLSHEDPAATARWATQLPYSAAKDAIHPATFPVARWMERDPAAAAAWLQSQPPDAPWIPPASP